MDNLDPQVNSETATSESYPPNSAVICLPKNVASYSLTSQTILEELRVRHRRLEMYGSSEITPSSLLTVDQIPELLQKQVQLTESHKTTTAISESLRELAGIGKHTEDRVVYFYPFFLKSEEKVLFKVAMVSPQIQERTDVTPYRRACVKYSIDLIESILQNRSNREVFLDETHPGKFLLKKDETGKLFFFPTRFGYEAEIESMIRKAMEPFSPIPMKDFVLDLITYGKETARLVELIPGYHIILPSGSHHPEFARHLACQIDALFTYAYPILKQISTKENYSSFIEKLDGISKELPSSTEVLIQKGKNFVPTLISLFSEFPFEKFTTEELKKTARVIQESIIILGKLNTKLSTQMKQDSEEIIVELIRSLKKSVTENSKNTLTLSKIDLHKELKYLNLTNELEKQKTIQRIVSELDSEFGCMELKEESIHVLFVLDQKYYSKIESNTFALSKYDSNYRNELSILDQIKAKLKNRNDENLDNLIEENDAEEEVLSEDPKPSKLKNLSTLNQLSKRLNLTYLLLTTIGFSISASLVGFLLNKPNFLLIGVPFSILFGFLVGYIFRKDEKVPTVIEDLTVPKTDKYQNLSKVVEKYIYPKKFNSINEKIYDPKRLKYRIEECLEEILPELPKSDQKKEKNKLIAEIEHSVYQISVAIKIPEALLLKGRSKELIMNKSDFRTVLFRTQVAEYYRKEAGLYKNDRDHLDYIQFIIREIEFGYNKYIKS